MASIDIIHAATASVDNPAMREGFDSVAESAPSMSPDVEQLMRDSAERSRAWLDSEDDDPSFF